MRLHIEEGTVKLAVLNSVHTVKTQPEQPREEEDSFGFHVQVTAHHRAGTQAAEMMEDS